MKKYRTWYNEEIKEVESLSETAKFALIKEDLWVSKSLEHPDNPEGRHYHDSWQDAKNFLIYREQQAIAKLEDEIRKRKATLQKIEEMKQCESKT